jgi:NAD(P)H-flavin reductase/hemoglobin-like flavoprotein
VTGAKADFFGRPPTTERAGTETRAASSQPDQARTVDTPSFDHGPQLRPAGFPPVTPRQHAGDGTHGAAAGDVEAAAAGSGVAVPDAEAALNPAPAGGEVAVPGGEVAVPDGEVAVPGGEVAAAGSAVTASGVSEASGAGAASGVGAAPAEVDGQLRGFLEGGRASPAQPHVAGIGRIGAAVDGMDPADDALLRETQRLLSTSLTFAGGPGEVAERFRAALLQARPELLASLPGSARTQTGQLARALTWLVHHLDQPPTLVTGCGMLGAALAECGVRPQQLQLVGAALAEAIRSGMPPGAWREDFDVAWRSTWQHVHEWVVHGGTLTQYQPTVWTAVVVEHDLRRHDLAVIRLRPDLPMPFRPGQYARVEVPELPGVWRPYSLAGKPRRDDLLELHVRAKTHGGVSGTLVYRTEVGDHVRLSRAEGSMGIPDEPGRNLLMIAGDTGVAPLKALLTELADTGDARSAVLFWGVRNLDELYDIDEIAEIARSARRATVVPVVSEGDPGPYASGLVTDAVAAYGEWSEHEVYLAGPPLMLAATSAALRLLGVAAEHIHHDAPE